MSVNTAFSRELLKRVLNDVRAYRTSTGDRFGFKLTDAWIYKVGTDHWEFHFGMFTPWELTSWNSPVACEASRREQLTRALSIRYTARRKELPYGYRCL